MMDRGWILAKASLLLPLLRCLEKLFLCDDTESTRAMIVWFIVFLKVMGGAQQLRSRIIAATHHRRGNPDAPTTVTGTRRKNAREEGYRRKEDVSTVPPADEVRSPSSDAVGSTDGPRDATCLSARFMVMANVDGCRQKWRALIASPKSASSSVEEGESGGDRGSTTSGAAYPRPLNRFGTDGTRTRGTRGDESR